MNKNIAMNKIEFDNYGNLKPYSIVKLTYDECKIIFVDNFPTSSTRSGNWNDFIRFHDDIEEISKYTVKHWIDGSFVTNKENPNDIDVVSFVNPNNLTESLQQFDMNKSDPLGYVKKQYNVDNYIILDLTPSHPYYAKIEEQIEYWKKWFGTDRDNNPKGMVEVAS